MGVWDFCTTKLRLHFYSMLFDEKNPTWEKNLYKFNFDTLGVKWWSYRCYQLKLSVDYSNSLFFIEQSQVCFCKHFGWLQWLNLRQKSNKNLKKEQQFRNYAKRQYLILNEHIMYAGIRTKIQNINLSNDLFFIFKRNMYEIVLVIDTLQLNQQLRKYWDLTLLLRKLLSWLCSMKKRLFE